MTGRVSIGQRIRQVSWGWYASSMSTGGIALLLNQTPHQFTGLIIIGKIVFILNLVVFSSISIAMGIRFISKPSTLKESFQSPQETHFFPTCVLAIATIIMGISAYGASYCGPWLIVALRVLFWLYVAIATLVAIFHNWYLYHSCMASRQTFALLRLLPSFPAMLSGTMASVLTSNQPVHHAKPMLIGGMTLQGFGFLMSLLVYAEYVFRANKDGLPKSLERPEMFIAVGPWSFTAVALIGMAQVAVEKWPQRYIISVADTSSISPTSVSAADIALVLATLSAVFMWMMAFFFFCIAAISTLAACRVFKGKGKGELGMSMAWWSIVFPNTGFTLATIDIGEALQSEGILWVTSVMTVLQVGVWLSVAVGTIWGVWNRELLWPAEMEEGNGKES